MYQKVNGQNTRMNLSGLGDLFIVFEDNLGQSLEFVEYPNQYTSKGGGEVVFRLSEKETKNILSLQNRVFKIYLENDAKERTFLYTGNFYSISEYQDLAKNSRIVDLENKVSLLNSQISILQNAVSELGGDIQYAEALNAATIATAPDGTGVMTIDPITGAMTSSPKSTTGQNNTNSQSSGKFQTGFNQAYQPPVQWTLDAAKASLRNYRASNMSPDIYTIGSTSGFEI
jgi:hypothetical protein